MPNRVPTAKYNAKPYIEKQVKVSLENLKKIQEDSEK